MAKKLLVTDYSGGLHINPIETKTYYQSRNTKTGALQYKFKEIDEDAALEFVEKNNGIDPDFKSPKEATQALADKDVEIAALKAALEAAKKNNPEAEKLKELMAELSTAKTSNSDYANAGANQQSQTPSETEKATDLIAKINSATSADEVNKLVPSTEQRKTVTDAATKKLGDLKK